MKFHAFLGAALAASAFILVAQGCTTNGDASPGGIKCTPGNYVFCRCADRAEGTKLCKEDGASFEACSTGNAGECVGGEDLTDPGTGEPVDPPVNPPTKAGPPGSPVDACPGKPTAVTPGTEIVVDGDTTGAKSDLKGRQGACSAGDGGPDHVYHLQPTGSGQLSIKVDGEGAFNPLMYLRTTCTDEESQSSCAPPLGPGGLVQFQTNVISGRDYFLVVDGASGTAGKYKLTMKLTTGAFCGDGKVDTGEACDDANKTEGDGCSNSCRAVDGNPAGADCVAPHKVDMWKGSTVSGTGSTVTYGNTFMKTGTSCIVSTKDLNLAPDHIYAVTAHSAGTLNITLTPEAAFKAQIVVRRACNDPNTSDLDANKTARLCANSGGPEGAVETLAVPVQNNETVYVAAEGEQTAKGAYTIKFELP